MDFSQYLPLNTTESIDRLLQYLSNNKLPHSSKKQLEVNCLMQIRKVKLQWYFKEHFEKINVNLSNEIKTNKSGSNKQKRKNSKGNYKKSTNRKAKEIQTEEALKKKKYFEVTPHSTLKSLKINELPGVLKWDLKVLYAILEKKGITKRGATVLNQEEYDKIKKDIEKRYQNLHFNSNKKHLNTRYKSKKKSGVYDKVAQYGIGKIILIRSK